MAIYHASVKILGRSAGRSATASAAYRAGVEIEDTRTGQVHNYRRKRGVVHTEILAPESAPAWVHDRAALWNAVEQAEKRKDAQLARELELALPAELSVAENRALLRNFLQAECVHHGMVADLAIHQPPRGGDSRNLHAHVLLTMRHLQADGFGRKATEWNPPMGKNRAGQTFVQDTTPLVNLRERWAQHANRALEAAGHAQRLDHRTLAAQGLERVPQLHQGPTVTALEQRGICTDRGDQARAIEHHNARLSELHAQRRDLDLQLNAGEARDQFRAAWQQHQAEQARQQQVHDLADNAAAEFRWQLDVQREAERTRERQPAHRPKPERDRERELKREREPELKRERERERSGPELDF